VLAITWTTCTSRHVPSVNVVDNFLSHMLGIFLLILVLTCFNLHSATLTTHDVPPVQLQEHLAIKRTIIARPSLFAVTPNILNINLPNAMPSSNGVSLALILKFWTRSSFAKESKSTAMLLFPFRLQVLSGSPPVPVCFIPSKVAVLVLFLSCLSRP
jgi:hypothetical protein